MSFLVGKTTAGTVLAGALLAGSVASSAPAARFDGNWSVLIVTETGTCDRAYRYAVKIENGAVRYSGEAGIEMSGRVAPNGKVQVLLSRGEQHASGSGQLSAEGGSGKWSGKSSSSECSGHWQAERRAAN
jgi:hypothetical protein